MTYYFLQQQIERYDEILELLRARCKVCGWSGPDDEAEKHGVVCCPGCGRNTVVKSFERGIL